MNDKITMILMMSIVALFVISCTVKPPVTPGTPKQPDTVTPTLPSTGEATQELKKFANTNDIIQYLKDNQASQSYGGFRGGGIMMESVMADSAMGGMTKSVAPSAAPTDGGGAADYSQTNVQVKGVDEADFVKNDDKYIYVLAQNKLVIVNAYPADNAEILSETEIDGTPRNMFVNNDKLIIFSENYEDTLIFEQYDFMPRPRSTSTTHVYVYDISNRKKPKEVKDYHLTGSYYESRMIDDYVYFITKQDLYYYNNWIDLPVVREAKTTILRPEIYYFDNPEQNYVFHTVASLDLNNDEMNAKSFLMGYSNALYVSKDNIYITYQKNYPWRWNENYNEDRFYKVVLPLLPNDVRDNINEVKDNKDLSSYEKWSDISSIMEGMYNNMEESDKEDLVKEIEDGVQEYDAKIEIERSKTVIQKISIDQGKIDYVAKGEVPGQPLNQFSMDEFDGYFRIATNVNVWARGNSETYNNVFVLDQNMEMVGKLEDIAPGESIYSTRFIGERLYMVTFKRIDPLFVIDLSDPKNPEILGKLKIPGYSDYLHPYDATHIIGIGKETEANDWGGTSTGGVKLALFDVSDVENPKQIDSVEIGEPGSDSEALRDHKAFLFDKEKNILVIPIREVKSRIYDSKYGYYRNRVWQGAYVFGVTPEDGFEKKGKITHADDESDDYYWNSPSAVRRSLYMDDVLYTISAKMIKMNDLNDLGNEIDTLDLPFKQQNYWEYAWY